MPVKKGCPFTLDATKCWLRVKLGKRTHHTVSYLIKNVEACGGMWRHIEYKGSLIDESIATSLADLENLEYQLEPEQ
jgi:hypothetical protein